ncbi:MAG TPA: hypothetical protein VIJ11_05105 [Galbitalea sp.]
MSRPFFVASAVTVAATTLIVGAAGPAFASSTPTPSPKSTTSTKTLKTLAQVQAAVAAGASKRTTALDKAVADITKNPYLTSSDKSKLSSILNGDLSSVKSDAAKAAGDTTLASAKTDARSMISGLRVFSVAIPQARIVAGADRLTATTLPKAEKVQTRVTAALSGDDSTKSTPAIQADLADLTKQIATIKADTASIASQALAVTPASYNANHGVVTSLKATWKSVRADVKKAHSDSKAIRTALRGSSDTSTK